MGLLSRLLALAVAVRIVSYVLATNGGVPEVLLHIPSILLVAGLMLAGLMLSFTPTQLLRAMDAGLSQSATCRPAEYGRHVLVLDRAAQCAWTAGYVTFLLGYIPMLPHIGPGEVGPALGVCMTALVWAALPAEFILRPLKYGVLHPASNAGVKPNDLPGSRHGTTLSFLLLAALLATALAARVGSTYY